MSEPEIHLQPDRFAASIAEMATGRMVELPEPTRTPIDSPILVREFDGERPTGRWFASRVVGFRSGQGVAVAVMIRWPVCHAAWVANGARGT